MSNENLYGKLSIDKDAKKMEECRHIVKTIVEYGVDDKQIVTIMRLLALEMEDYGTCVTIVEALKEISGGYFLTERFEDGSEKSK